MDLGVPHSRKKFSNQGVIDYFGLLGGVIVLSALILGTYVVSQRGREFATVFDIRQQASCISCDGGTCPDGWSYGSDSCAPQASCDQRKTEACASHQGGGSGSGSGSCVDCAICSPLNNEECQSGSSYKCVEEGNACGGAKVCWRPGGNACAQSSTPLPSNSGTPQNTNTCSGSYPTASCCLNKAAGAVSCEGVSGTCTKTTQNTDGTWLCSYTFAGACTAGQWDVTNCRKCNPSGSGWNYCQDDCRSDSRGCNGLAPLPSPSPSTKPKPSPSPSVKPSPSPSTKPSPSPSPKATNPPGVSCYANTYSCAQINRANATGCVSCPSMSSCCGATNATALKTICSAGKTSCSFIAGKPTTQLCNAGGTGYVSSQECGTGMTCNAVGTGCETKQTTSPSAATCYYGVSSCSTLNRAAATGCGSCPTGSASCCGAPLVLGNACTAGKTTCSSVGGKPTIQVCKSDGTGYLSSQACAVGWSCDAGGTTCAPPQKTADNGSCGTNADCQSNNCQLAPGGKICRPSGTTLIALNKELGDSCNAYTQCQSTLACIAGTCQVPPPVAQPKTVNGQLCVDNSSCQSNNCQPAPGGKYCVQAGATTTSIRQLNQSCGTSTYDGQCADSLVCSSNVCSVPAAGVSTTTANSTYLFQNPFTSNQTTNLISQTTVFGGTTTYGNTTNSAYAQGSGLYAGSCTDPFGHCIEDLGIISFGGGIAAGGAVATYPVTVPAVALFGPAVGLDLYSNRDTLADTLAFQDSQVNLPPNSYYLLKYNGWVTIRNNGVYDAHTGAYIGPESAYDNSAYVANTVVSGPSILGLSQHTSISNRTFETPLWQDLSAKNEKAVAGTTSTLAAVTASANVVHNSLTYDALTGNTYARDSPGGVSVTASENLVSSIGTMFVDDRSLETLISAEHTICFDFAITQHLLLAEQGITTQIVSSNTLDHVFLVTKINGTDYVVDPTWNIVMPLSEHQKLYNYNDLQPVDSPVAPLKAPVSTMSPQ